MRRQKKKDDIYEMEYLGIVPICHNLHVTSEIIGIMS